jgi:hypothetical protein
MRGGDATTSGASPGGGGAGFWGGGSGSDCVGFSGDGGGGGGSSFVLGSLDHCSSLDTTASPAVTITPYHIALEPPAPCATGWTQSLQAPGSSAWVSGCRVRYHVAYELPSGRLLHGPWWTVQGGTVDGNGFYGPPGANPSFTGIGCDPTGQAVARRLYRQFYGSAAVTLVARIANNVDTTCTDTAP